jgi:shikimate kinase
MHVRKKQIIYLLGFMGVGKSTIGALLAERLRWPFIDLDATIAAGQGTTIRQMFEQSGEPFFRQIEHVALLEASKAEPAVIALGGGTFAQKANFDFIREMGAPTVWLDCPIDELRRRCKGKTDRPLFRDPASFARLFEERLPFYRLAQFRVATEGITPEQVVDAILKLQIFGTQI